MKIALVSKKGGVAKTSTAVSLAAALANRGRNVLLVDLDPQASSSLWLGVERAGLAPSVADVLFGSIPAADAIRETRVRGLSLLTSSADLAAADRELGSLRDRDQVLRRKLEEVAEEYDYVFFDCPPSLTLLPSLALVAADAFLLPVTPQFLASEGLENMMSAIERLAFRNGRRCRCLGLLLTLVDYRTKLSKQKVPELREQFGNRVFAIEVRTNVRLAEAPAYGLTIFEYDPRSTAAKAYGLLAEELEMRCAALEARERVAASEVSVKPPEIASSRARVGVPGIAGGPAGEGLGELEATSDTNGLERTAGARFDARPPAAACDDAETVRADAETAPAADVAGTENEIGDAESERPGDGPRRPRRDRPTWIPGLPKTVVGLN